MSSVLIRTLERRIADLEKEIQTLKARTSFEHAVDAVFYGDAHGNVTEVNGQAFCLTGYPREELLRMNMRDLFTEEDGDSANLRFDALAESVSVLDECAIRTKKGERISVEICSTKLSDGRYQVILKDITRRSLEKKILIQESQQKARKELALDISHEINNLTTGIMGSAGLLRLQNSLDDQQRAHLDRIVNQAKNVGSLAEQLRSYSQIKPEHLEVGSVNECLKRVLHSSGNWFHDFIDLETSFSPGLDPVKADLSQLENVFANLVKNACEAMGPKGILFVSTENFSGRSLAARHPLSKGDWVKISISDSGEGMDQGTRERAFDPFFSTKKKGRGLGLSAAQGIVQSHGGQIFLHSEKQKGTEVVLYLPAEKQFTDDIAHDKSAFRGDETILIVDDEQVIVEITSQILEAFGYTTLKAFNGLEAVEIVRSNQCKIDLIMLDLKMPVMSGVEAFHLIKKMKPNLKIIICSGYELNAAAKELVHYNMDMFLRKPFGVRELLPAVRNTIDRQVRLTPKEPNRE